MQMTHEDRPSVWMSRKSKVIDLCSLKEKLNRTLEEDEMTHIGKGKERACLILVFQNRFLLSKTRRIRKSGATCQHVWFLVFF